MPLLKGKKNIGRNIEELKAHGSRNRPLRQILAIALNVAGVARKADHDMAKKKIKKKKVKK